MRVRLLPLAVCCLLLVSVSCSREPQGSPEVERSLAALDEALAQKAAFDQRKEARIEALRGQLHQAGTDEQRYARSRELFQEYSSYQFDSAYSYVQRMRWRNAPVLSASSRPGSTRRLSMPWRRCPLRGSAPLRSWSITRCRCG